MEYIDIVIEDQQDISAKLDVKIAEQVKVANIEGSRLKFGFNKTADYSYHFKVNAPVIIAYMPRKQSRCRWIGHA